MLDLEDGIDAAHKFKAFVGTLVILLVSGVATALYAPAVPVYSTFTTALVSTFGIYCGIAVAHKFVTGSINGKYFNKPILADNSDSDRTGDPEDEENG